MLKATQQGSIEAVVSKSIYFALPEKFSNVFFQENRNSMTLHSLTCDTEVSLY